MSYRCISCGDTTTLIVYDTHKQLTLFCGSYYNISVRAGKHIPGQSLDDDISGQSSVVNVRLAPKVDAVTNLTVRVFPVKENDSQSVFDVDEGFQLTWKKPQNAEDIEVSTLSV